MGNTKNTIEKMDILDFSLPAYSEIPDVGLYLKQVVKYINEALGQYLDLSVTDTMISNYVKMRLVPNAIKKLYYRDQIASFLFIVLAKPVISLDHIQFLLKVKEERYQAKEAYELFSEAFMRTLRSVFGTEEDTQEPEDAYQALVKNIIIAIVQKYYIERSFRQLQLDQKEGENQ
ncbi:MAG: DUF1836 domain-containing protein [Lachnospiraceae bacterium]|nr:DUF1836 domain-containing protein [Lachnospiraceae bacterium]